jgi:hypothetical protein
LEFADPKSSAETAWGGDGPSPEVAKFPSARGENKQPAD